MEQQQPPAGPRWLAFAALITGMLMGSSAQAAAFDVSDVETHGDWQVATLSAPGEAEGPRHFRAVESASYTDATLSVNATPGVCDMPWLEMRVRLDTLEQATPETRVLPAQLRVDDKTLQKSVVEFFTQPANNGFYVHFYLNDRARLLNDMRSGEQLFLGFDQGEREPWYMIFSMDGAGDAIDAALTRCRRATGI